MESDGKGRTRLEYHILRAPDRLHPLQDDDPRHRPVSHVLTTTARSRPTCRANNGVLVSRTTARPWPTRCGAGRPRPHVHLAGDKLYEGMIIGIHSRDNDWWSTRSRASSSPTSLVRHDEAVRLTRRSATLDRRGIHRRTTNWFEITPKSIDPASVTCRNRIASAPVARQRNSRPGLLGLPWIEPGFARVFYVRRG